MVASSPRNRPAPDSKRFDVELTVVSLTNLRLSSEEETLVSVDVKWKGPKSAFGGSRFRKSQKKDNTSAEVVSGAGAVVWGEGVSKFKHQCVLLGAKTQGYEEAAYQAWDVNFVILKVSRSIVPDAPASEIGTLRSCKQKSCSFDTAPIPSWKVWSLRNQGYLWQ